MNTKIFQITKDNHINNKSITEAAAILSKGGTVAFPTETVYGLGANALDPRAVDKIFIAKGRPSDNPLIVHISNEKELKNLVTNVPLKAKQLIEAFWPGALTIIFEKQDKVSDKVTGNLATVAVRMPKSQVALALIEAAGVPVAAPSANISGRPSPTKAEHVIEDLDGRVDGIVAGEDCQVGLESTVIDLTVDPPMILRPGGVSKEAIEAVVGKILLDKGLEKEASEKPKAPGMKYTHYAPKAKVIVFEGDRIEKIIEKIKEVKNEKESEGMQVGILASEETKMQYEGTVFTLGSREDIDSVGKELFNALRRFDKTEVDVILAESFTKEGLGLAIMNRMVKSAGYNIIYVGSE